MLLFSQVAAQKSAGVWDAGQKGVRAVKKKTANKVSAFKAWKAHLQSWGLDSSYNQSLALGGRLNSDGWSSGLFYGHGNHHGQIAFWQLTFSEVKHEKEIKQQRANTAFPELGPGTPFIFGKINNLYLLQIGYGRERLLLPSVLEGNVSIGFRYNGGLSLAMLKPYYLKLIYLDYSVIPATAFEREESYSEENKERFLNNGLILGKGRWTKGLADMNYIPGLYAEAALTIIPRKSKAFMQKITLGINGAFYSNKLSILADGKSYPWRACLFAGLELGKHWKR